MKSKRSDNSITLRIRIALFLGWAWLIPIDRLADLFRTASYSHRSGLDRWLWSRFILTMFTPMWLEIHCRWVDSVTEEGLAKDTFFSCRLDYGDGVENPLQNVAIVKWLTFLTDPLNEYQLRMVHHLAIGCPCWTEPGTKANLMAKARLDQFATVLIEQAESVFDLRVAYRYVREYTPVHQLWVERREYLSSPMREMPVILVTT